MVVLIEHWKHKLLLVVHHTVIKVVGTHPSVKQQRQRLKVSTLFLAISRIIPKKTTLTGVSYHHTLVYKWCTPCTKRSVRMKTHGLCLSGCAVASLMNHSTSHSESKHIHDLHDCTSGITHIHRITLSSCDYPTHTFTLTHTPTHTCDYPCIVTLTHSHTHTHTHTPHTTNHPHADMCKGCDSMRVQVDAESDPTKKDRVGSTRS